MPAASSPLPSPEPPPRGLLVLHGNRLETLHELVLHCHERWPLAPLCSEVVLVQSNGAGEWFKAAQAGSRGISAAMRVELPSRFVWQVYRQVLGPAALSARSPLDRQALVWRLLRLLPDICARPGYEPLAAFLRDDDPLRPLQLAQRLADLYDQYQVYRADWLDAWAGGRDELIDARGRVQALDAAQAWQARLWRELLDGLGDAARVLVRPQVHQRVLERLRAAAPGSLGLPPRVSLFGAATLAPAVLELLVALSRHAQVLIAVPNPCRFHWADIVEGRELLRAARRRHALRGGRDLAEVPLQHMHAHAHPLLAAWGRQGRDFMRQLDASAGDQASAGAAAELPRTDVFDERDPRTLLERVQAAIRDLLPLAEHASPPLPDSDDSMQFHVTHGALREVEVLHDALLGLLARDWGAQGALRPRDIVVMVPDVEVFAPAIRAVFGQYAADDARHIPFDIADLRRRHSHSLLLALAWLLDMPRRRITVSELCELLDVPALAARFGLDPADRPQLTRWMSAAGARWGLHAAQRASLGLQACGDTNSWWFGLRRMLLGYASGDTGRWKDIEPLEQVGGLDAELAGVLHGLLELLQHWWEQCLEPAMPAQWAQRARDLLAGALQPTDEVERHVLGAAHDALAQWLHDCECAGFQQPLAQQVFAQAWLDRIDHSSASGRFLAGGVTFCSLLPLRAIPFEVVCLLGMNEDAYPRAAQRNDFDLMAQPGMFRAGDRSRRDDDRYLMLEALLSARRVFHVSWCGRSARDNTPLQPSVLVAQLRDYLAAGFASADARDGEAPGAALLRARTTEHPLQPFSRRYFEPGGLRSYASEWFALHGRAAQATPSRQAVRAPAQQVPAATLRELVALLRNPVKLYFRHRLNVVFDEAAESADDEAFSLRGLERHALQRQLLDEWLADEVRAEAQAGQGDASFSGQPGASRDWLHERLRRAAGAGRLPLGGPGEFAGTQLAAELEPVLDAWRELERRHARRLPARALRLQLDAQLDADAACEASQESVRDGGVRLQDWLDGLRSAPHAQEHAQSDAQSNAQAGPQADPQLLQLSASRLLDSHARVRAARLLDAWVRMLAAAACGQPCGGYLVALDCVLQWEALPQQQAHEHMQRLLRAWALARTEPLPWGLDSAIAQAQQRAARVAYEGSMQRAGDVAEPCLARMYPDFDSLCADGRFEAFAASLFAPLCEWAQQHVRVLPLPAASAASVSP